MLQSELVQDSSHLRVRFQEQKFVCYLFLMVEKVSKSGQAPNLLSLNTSLDRVHLE